MKLASWGPKVAARNARTILGILLGALSRVLSWAARVTSTHGKTLSKENRIWFEGPYTTWVEAENVSSGYRSEEIFKKVLDSTLEVVSGAAAFERDSVSFFSKETSWPLMGAVNLAAAGSRGELQVLDFGGSLGSMFLQHRDELRDFHPVRWTVIEQEEIVELGNRHISVEGLRFFTSINQGITEKPALIVLGSVLQYLPNYRSTLEELLDLRSDVIFLDRHPCRIDKSGQSQTIVVQHVPPRIYTASYPMRIFRDGELDAYFLRNYRLALAQSSASEATRLDNGLKFKWASQIWVRKRIS